MNESSQRGQYQLSGYNLNLSGPMKIGFLENKSSSTEFTFLVNPKKIENKFAAK
jgi:hypothetical protein